MQLRTLPVLPAQAIAGITPRFTDTARPPPMPRKRSQSELPGADELYARLFAEQGGVCAICGKPPRSRRLHIDHNHRTHRVRGLLCFRCNRALPTYTDSEWLRRACEYVAMDEQAGVPDQWQELRSATDGAGSR